MTVLITGGSGFVGLNLVEQLLGRGEEVVALSVGPVPESALAAFRRAPGRLHVVMADVLDRDRLDAAIGEHRADRIIHAAAITAGAERDAREPRRIAEVNLLGTIEVLEAARRHGVRRLLHVGTGSVFGRNGLVDGALDEARHTPLPESLYGISKYAAERTCLRCRALWGLDVLVGRLAMVFGRWEYDTGLRDRLSPLLQAWDIARRGGEAVLPDLDLSDWIYAPDVARGLLAILDAEAPRHDLYHVGAGAPWPITAWCERLRARYPDFRYRVSNAPEDWTVVPLGGGRSPFAARRIRDDLGFRPAYDLDAAFADYMNWLEAHPL